MTILDELADYARVRVANNKNILSFSELRKRVNEIDIGNFEFEQQLKKDDISLIIILAIEMCISITSIHLYNIYNVINKWDIIFLKFQ